MPWSIIRYYRLNDAGYQPGSEIESNALIGILAPFSVRNLRCRKFHAELRGNGFRVQNIDFEAEIVAMTGDLEAG